MTCTYWYRGWHVCIIPPPLTQTQIPLLHFCRDLFSPVSLLQAVRVCASSSVASMALDKRFCLRRKTPVPIKWYTNTIIIRSAFINFWLLTLTFSSTSSGAAILESCCHLSNFGEVVFRSFLVCTYMHEDIITIIYVCYEMHTIYTPLWLIPQNCKNSRSPVGTPSFSTTAQWCRQKAFPGSGPLEQEEM